MPVAYLTRVVRFTAQHRLHRDDWSPAQNRERFGTASVEHGHDYRCEVTVRGPTNADGMVMDLGALDRILASEVAQRFDGKRLHDMQEFEGAQATGEMICIDVWNRVQAKLPPTCALFCVKVAEDDTLWSEYRGE